MDRKQSENYKLKEIGKIQILKLSKNQYATHLWYSVNKMCIFEMDPACSVEDAERTRFCP